MGSADSHEAWAVGSYNTGAQNNTAEEAVLIVQASVALGPMW